MARPALLLNPKNMPPLWQVALFLLTAPVYLLLASLLVATAGIGAVHTTPAILAATHAFTLGVFVISALGAAIQIYAVVLGLPVRLHSGVLMVAYVGLNLGILMLIGQFVLPQFTFLSKMAARVLLFGLLAVLYPFRICFAGHWRLPQSGLRLFPALLLLMLATGIVLLATRTPDWPDMVRWLHVSVWQHAATGLLVLIPLVVLSMALHILPMFYVHAPPPKVLIISVFAALFIGLALLYINTNAGSIVLALAQIGMALLLLRMTTQVRRRADASLRSWQLALAGLLSAALLVLGREFYSAISITSIGLMYLAGFMATLIIGMSQRILGFLCSLHSPTMSLAKRTAATSTSTAPAAPVTLNQFNPQRQQQRLLKLQLLVCILLLLGVLLPVATNAAMLLEALVALLWLLNLGHAMKNFYRHIGAEADNRTRTPEPAEQS